MHFRFVIIIISLSYCDKLLCLHILQLHVGSMRGYILLFTLIELECTDAMDLVVPVPD